MKAPVDTEPEQTVWKCARLVVCMAALMRLGKSELEELAERLASRTEEVKGQQRETAAA